MRARRFCRLLTPLWLPLFLGAVPFSARTQEIPLKHCGKLPVIEVEVASQSMLFLVDTAATSFLDLKSFAEGKMRDIEITSWTGTLATRILGVDLLARLGATINLKKQTVHVTTLNEERGADLAAEMHSEMQHCLEAFNTSDERAFGDCLDPKIVLFSMETALYGREQVIGYFRERYFHQRPAAQLEIRESEFHAIGEAVWYEYDFTIEYARGVLRGRGMAMCKKSEGRWRMASMHHSMMEMEHSSAAK